MAIKKEKYRESVQVNLVASLAVRDGADRKLTGSLVFISKSRMCLKSAV